MRLIIDLTHESLHSNQAITLVEDRASNGYNELKLKDQLNLHLDTIYLMQQGNNFSICY